jgi:hypothetical protein
VCVCGGSIMLTAANEGKQVGGSIEMTGERGLAACWLAQEADLAHAAIDC